MKRKIFKKSLFLNIIIFIIFFGIFNLLPIIPTKFNPAGINNDTVLCPLNYAICIQPHFGDNFPALLKNLVFMLCLLPIIFPLIFSYLSVKIFRKHSIKRKGVPHVK